MAPSIVETTDDYYHVRFNDPDRFDTIRTPDWAENAASSVAGGAKVRTGHQEGGDDSDWEIQSVLVPNDEASDEDDAIAKAEQIVEKIESCSVQHRKPSDGASVWTEEIPTTIQSPLRPG